MPLRPTCQLWCHFTQMYLPPTRWPLTDYQIQPSVTMIAACTSPVPPAPTFPAFTVLHPSAVRQQAPSRPSKSALPLVVGLPLLFPQKYKSPIESANSRTHTKFQDLEHFVIVACFSVTSSELLRMFFFAVSQLQSGSYNLILKKGLNPQYSLYLESLSKERPKARRARNPKCKSTITVVPTLGVGLLLSFHQTNVP